jgi:hypothetical protein
LPTLVARYQHAWNHAANDALRNAADRGIYSRTGVAAPSGSRSRAARTGPRRRNHPRRQPDRGPHRGRRLRHPHRCPVHRTRPRQPQPGLPHHHRRPARRASRPATPLAPRPMVGHPAWSAYLKFRAGLITNRASELRTLTEAYRERYPPIYPPAISAPNPPEVSNRRLTAPRLDRSRGPTCPQIPELSGEARL